MLPGDEREERERLPSGPVERSIPPSDVRWRLLNAPDSTATSQPAGNRTLAELPLVPLDAYAHTGSVTRLVPTRTCGFAPLPVAGRLNVSRYVAALPLYRRDPNPIRSNRASFVVLATRTVAPLAPETRNPVHPGWTARNAWSKKNLRVLVSAVWLRAVTATDTAIRRSSGSTVYVAFVTTVRSGDAPRAAAAPAALPAGPRWRGP